MLGTEGRRFEQVQRRDVLRSLIAGLLAGAFPGGALASQRVIVSKMALIDGRAVLALQIGEGGPYLFMIDTGGHLSLIDDALARSLKLEQTGMTRSVGIGGVAVLPLYLARNVVFGGGAMQPFVAFAGMAHGFAGDVRGTLAAGMLTAVESDLDFENGEWRAYPNGRPERIGFVRISNAIAGNRLDALKATHVRFPPFPAISRTSAFDPLRTLPQPIAWPSGLRRRCRPRASGSGPLWRLRGRDGSRSNLSYSQTEDARSFEQQSFRLLHNGRSPGDPAQSARHANLTIAADANWLPPRTS